MARRRARALPKGHWGREEETKGQSYRCLSTYCVPGTGRGSVRMIYISPHDSPPKPHFPDEETEVQGDDDLSQVVPWSCLTPMFSSLITSPQSSCVAPTYMCTKMLTVCLLTLNENLGGRPGRWVWTSLGSLSCRPQPSQTAPQLDSSGVGICLSFYCFWGLFQLLVANLEETDTHRKAKENSFLILVTRILPCGCILFRYLFYAPSLVFMKTGLFVNRHFLSPHWGCGPCLVLPGHRLLFSPPLSLPRPAPGPAGPCSAPEASHPGPGRRWASGPRGSGLERCSSEFRPCGHSCVA